MMSKSRKKIGLAPGTLVFTGNKKVDKVIIHQLSYNNEQLEQGELDSHNEHQIAPLDNKKVDWFDVRGMHDTELIAALGANFGMHPLTLENTVDIHQRPKFEEYEEGFFITLKALQFKAETREVIKEHLAIYVTDGAVISFQETETDLFAPVRERLERSSGRIRSRGADYLAFALMDVVVDHYYVVIEGFEEVINHLEEELTDNPSPQIKGEIHHLKKELLQLRKKVIPLREATSQFSKSEHKLIVDTTPLFVRDLYEHTVHVIDNLDSNRDLLNGLQDLYISELSFKMNKVMQLLTLVSTIFIPLTFLAGIYGMNFTNIPELHYQYGYFVLLGIMLVITIILIIFFRRKHWM
ncbi:magnesium/cobalt transporter CorA [Gilvibacter sediminis]|uniref:magnesium/cobalt transporter CorA n=1 Tax=Gilvibacter sediminis TaxID=379071 RepID=UPI00234FBCCA|nr:magnesium/cobalt transporter CorA [Gilvibacter sediminis]MDC7999376.1 magnesium/cobalt transporter CorA [Gilvibacter sediminis]